MAAPNLSELDALAVKYIMPGIADLFFKNDPLLQYMKRNRYFVWNGGPRIQAGFLFLPMIGAAYAPGTNFNITRNQTKAALLFDWKYYYTNVTEQLEHVEVVLRSGSPQVIADMVAIDLQNAAMTMSGLLANALYRNGQGARSLELNGLEEALTNGTDATFATAAPGFPSYGDQARADVSPALNSPTGLQAANVGGAISFRVLEHSYQSCTIGSEHPVMGITTNRCMGFISEHFSPQQRLVDTVEPTIGFTGVKFKSATILESQYAPGQDITTQDVQYLGATIPTTTGETFTWLNPGPEGDDAYLKLYFSASPKFQFGFTGFKIAQDNTTVAGQVLFGGNFVCRAQRYMRTLFGITA